MRGVGTNTPIGPGPAVLMGILRCGCRVQEVTVETHNVLACLTATNEVLEEWHPVRKVRVATPVPVQLAAWSPCRSCPVPAKCKRTRTCALPSS